MPGGADYRVPSPFILSVSGNNVQQGYVAPATQFPSQAFYLTGIDIQLIGPSAVAVASIVGAPTANGGFGFHAQQGPAMPYIDEDFTPPIQCIPGATVGIYLPTPPVTGGTWNAHLYGFVGDPVF